MGVTIHFKGKLDDCGLIDSFCNEMEDIAKEMEWEYTRIDDITASDENPLKGVIVSPHKNSESLMLTVDSAGTLRNVFMMQFIEEYEDLTYHNFIKTQFAPVEIHIAVVHLLKYIRQKYMSNLDVTDEGSYWETSDAKLLREKIAFLTSIMDKLEGVLKTATFNKEDSVETVADKLEQLLSKKFSRIEVKKIKRKS
jgi:hypothetical protein